MVRPSSAQAKNEHIKAQNRHGKRSSERARAALAASAPTTQTCILPRERDVCPVVALLGDIRHNSGCAPHPGQLPCARVLPTPLLRLCERLCTQERSLGQRLGRLCVARALLSMGREGDRSVCERVPCVRTAEMPGTASAHFPHTSS